MARSAMTWRRLLLALPCSVVAFFGYRNSVVPRVFASKIQDADTIVLHEGLPHQRFERDLLQHEKETKPVDTIHDYPFYQQTIELTAEDARALGALLAAPSSYETFWPVLGEKFCGGFHPDYAVEWRRGQDSYQALLCFGCGEVELFGPLLVSRHNLRGREKLRAILTKYRRNRPSNVDAT